MTRRPWPPAPHRTSTEILRELHEGGGGRGGSWNVASMESQPIAAWGFPLFTDTTDDFQAISDEGLGEATIFVAPHAGVFAFSIMFWINFTLMDLGGSEPWPPTQETTAMVLDLEYTEEFRGSLLFRNFVTFPSDAAWDSEGNAQMLAITSNGVGYMKMEKGERAALMTLVGGTQMQGDLLATISLQVAA